MHRGRCDSIQNQREAHDLSCAPSLSSKVFSQLKTRQTRKAEVRIHIWLKHERNGRMKDQIVYFSSHAESFACSNRKKNEIPKFIKKKILFQWERMQLQYFLILLPFNNDYTLYHTNSDHVIFNVPIHKAATLNNATFLKMPQNDIEYINQLILVSPRFCKWRNYQKSFLADTCINLASRLFLWRLLWSLLQDKQKL